MKRVFGLTVFLVLLISLTSIAFAEDFPADGFGIWSKNIEIKLDAEGKAQVSEKYYLYFSDDTAKLDFRNKSTELGLNLDKWKQFNSVFAPTIGQDNLINGKTSYIEGDPALLDISYDLVDSLMDRKRETTLMEEYSIKANYFNKLYQSGIWIIPDNVTISIILPPGAEIRGDVQPNATIENSGSSKKITWTGYASANQLALTYLLWKKTDPIIDMAVINDFIFRTNEGIALLAIIGVIIIIVLWKRKKIANKIEGYVEENTSFDS